MINENRRIFHIDVETHNAEGNPYYKWRVRPASCLLDGNGGKCCLGFVAEQREHTNLMGLCYAASP